MKKFTHSLLYSALLSAGLVACGGGSGGSSSTTNTGSTSAPVKAVGQIDGFGSVIVNGVHYDTDNAVIMVNGEQVQEMDLKVGYLVQVTGEINQTTGRGVAVRIEYTAEVEGPISNIDVSTGTITVFGQTILINDDTVLDDLIDNDSLTGLSQGVSVEVSGFRNANGEIVAAHVEIEVDGETDDFQLAGVITDIDLESSSITINGQEVDISALGNIDIDLEALEEGERIVVSGSINGETLMVDDDIFEDDFDFDDDTESTVELEGIITAVSSDLTFSISGVPVSITDSTEFEFGGLGDIREGLRVEVEGRFNDENVLVAHEIQFSRALEIETEGSIEAIDLEAGTFTLRGLTFSVTEDTRWEDDSEMDERQFDLEDLRVGDFLAVAAFVDDQQNERIVAKHIERFDLEEEEEHDEAELLDRVVNVEGDFLILQNSLMVRVTDNTEFNDDISLADLVNMLVEIEGFFEGDVLTADFVEVLHDCDIGDEDISISDDEELVGVEPSVICERDEDDEEIEEGQDEEGEIEEDIEEEAEEDDEEDMDENEQEQETDNNQEDNVA